MEDSQKGTKTRLGFRDISFLLETETLEVLKKYDVVRGINLDSEKLEIHYDRPAKIYNFNSQKYDLRGRIFPMDEIINLNQEYDIIIQNWKKTINPINVDAQIYHDFYPEEKLKVEISRRTFGKDPSFKLFNYIAGFVKDPKNGLYEKIDEGSKVLVKVYRTWIKDKKIHIFTYPLKFL